VFTGKTDPIENSRDLNTGRGDDKGQRHQRVREADILPLNRSSSQRRFKKKGGGKRESLFQSPKSGWGERARNDVSGFRNKFMLEREKKVFRQGKERRGDKTAQGRAPREEVTIPWQTQQTFNP